MLATFRPVAYAGINKANNEPDTVKLFAYTTTHDSGRGGLRLAWSADDGATWMSIAGGYSFLKCDYGSWGSEKRMIDPVLTRDSTGLWHCVWKLDPLGNCLAHASSADLQKWKPQDYSYAADKRWSYNEDLRNTIIILGNDTLRGSVSDVAYADVDDVVRYAEQQMYRAAKNAELMSQDSSRFALLETVNAVLTTDTFGTKAISNRLIGVFFEDINYGADGGLYAELIQNRDFEYSPADGSKLAGWGSGYAWTARQKAVQNDEAACRAVAIAEENPLSVNNPHYAVIEKGITLTNSGYDGISLRESEKYDFSMFARLADGGDEASVTIRLADENGNEIARGSVNVTTDVWSKVEAVLTATGDADAATLFIEPDGSAALHVDLVSLFPQNTFRGRRNGLRADIAEAIAALNPKFVRFPGGCVSHGDGIDNIYDWKGSIGNLEDRKPLRNLWRYHQTRGLGFYEYFLFCEDIGAEPVPVVSAGVPCQNSATPSRYTTGELTRGGQQGGIPMADMGDYVQDVLDLIEYANGDSTTEWGRRRAQSGHPQPFNLKYIGIGNEDLISEAFEERFQMIYKAVTERYPDITVIGTVGPFYEGSDYDEGWLFATRLGVPVVDEHYYNPPGWFINNQNFYDRYDRAKPKVYLGEYAAHLASRASNIETALAEAIYLLSVERNADVVIMASYAPLLGRRGYTRWRPDLIYFTNSDVIPTVNYYVQQLFGLNAGDEYIPSSIVVDNDRDDVGRRIAASVVRDSSTGDLILKMANLLPVEVNASIELPVDDDVTTATATVLKGSPDDTQAMPTDSTIGIGRNFSHIFPPYSLTVIRCANH